MLSSIVIKLNESCNMQCDYCYVDAVSVNKSFKEIERPYLFYIIEEIFNTGKYDKDKPLYIYLHGGEPLLSINIIDELCNCLTKITDCDSYRLMLQTNGLALNNIVIKYLKSKNINLGISIDGVNHESNQLRLDLNGKSTYRKVMNNIEKCLKNDLPVGVACVVSSHNVNDISTYVKDLYKMGVRSFSFNFLVSLGRAKSRPDILATCNQLFENFVKVIQFSEVAAAHGDPLFVRELLALLYALFKGRPYYMCSGNPCGAGFCTLGVSTSGNIYVCDQFIGLENFCIADSKNSFERIAEIQSEKPVFNSIKKQNFKKCKSCRFDNVCFKGCPAINLASSKDAEAPALCEFYYRIFDYLILETPSHMLSLLS